MNAARLRLGEIVAGSSAVLLLVLMTLDWARPEESLLRDPGAELPPSLNSIAERAVGAFVNRLAQSGYTTLGWVLVAMILLLVAAALALVVVTVTERETPVLAVVAAVGTTFWALVVFVTLFLRLTLGQPDLGLALTADRVKILGPAWFGLLCVAAIGAGGWLTLRDDRLDSPLSVPPEVPVRPAPPATA
jgi:hypothetical protein